MKISRGQYKGKSLKFPKDKRIRPTQSRVREAIMNICWENCKDTAVLDICCGTGSLGIEALSSGAEYVTFIDSDIRYVKQNIELINPNKNKINIIKGKLEIVLPSLKDKYSLIFLDPPWKRVDLYKQALMAIAEFGILSPGGKVICEHPKDVKIESGSSLKLIKEYKYGDTMITVYTL